MSTLKLCLLTLLFCVFPVLTSGAEGFSRNSFWLLDPGLSDQELAEHVEVLKNSGVNTVILGGGDHHYLFNQDIDALNRYLSAAGKVVDLCHKSGIKVIEHHSNVLISPEKCDKSLEPMLLMGFSSDGNSGIWPEYGTRSFCPNSRQYREMYWKKLCYILDQVEFDGIMSDDASFHAGCACKNCQDRWQAENGGDIFSAYIAGKETGTPGWIQWNSTRKRWMLDFRHWLDRSIKERYPGLVHYILANDSTSPWPSQISGLYPELYGETGDVIVWEIYNPADFYSFRRLAGSAAVYREMCELSSMQAGAFTLLPYADTASRRDIFDRNEETFMWGFSLCAGGDFTFARVYLTGITPDDQPEDFFQFERQFLADRKSWGTTCADVGILFSPDSRDIDPQWEGLHVSSYHGWAQLLQDNGIPYRALTGKSLDTPLNLKLIIVPDVFAISGEDLTKLRDYASTGGKVLLSGLNFICRPDGSPWSGERNFDLRELKLTPQTLPLEPERNAVGSGEFITLNGSLPRELFQNQINEESAWIPRGDTGLARDLARLVANEAGPSIRLSSASGELPLYTVYSSPDGTVSIPMLNTLGADLAPGQTVPSPSRVIWGDPVEITVHTTKPVKSAYILSYPDGRKTGLTVSDGHNITLSSPEKFQLLTLEF